SLIDDLRPLESQPLIKPAGAVVLRSDLQKNPLASGRSKTSQRMPDQNGSQTVASVGRRDTDILDRSDLVFRHALNRSAQLRAPRVLRPILQEPGGLRHKSRPANDLRHQPTAAVALAQRGKNVGVQLPAKATILHFRMSLQEAVIPGR